MHYHIVGIAGAGMSAIAHLLLDQGHTVSGSDLLANRMTESLHARGATTHVGHSGALVAGADALLATAAAKPDHPEVVAAREASIPIIGRKDLWREWSRQRDIIAIAGSHGKTTTTAMVALLLKQAGYAPGYLVGSESFDLGGNAQWGNPSAPLVIEADEYDRAFLALTPALAVVTNIDWDHPDIYPTSADYLAAFGQFAAQTRQVVLTCGDGLSHEVRETLAGGAARLTTYGLDEANDYRALPFAPDDDDLPGSVPFAIRRKNQMLAGRYQVALPGAHNVCNGLAALAVADILGVEVGSVAEALRAFRSTARRLEVKGEAGGVIIVDDYAHHPTEIRATLAAARARYEGRRVVAYVQPHTYSRTWALLDQWEGAFAQADVVLVGDIYAAREAPPPGVTPTELAALLVGCIARSHSDVSYAGSVDEAIEAARARLRPGDLLLTLGAGDGCRVGEALL